MCATLSSLVFGADSTRRTLVSRFAAQFRSPLIYVLLFALLVDISVWLLEGARGLPFESFAIVFILALNAGLGVYQEGKAEAARARHPPFTYRRSVR